MVTPTTRTQMRQIRESVEASLDVHSDELGLMMGGAGRDDGGSDSNESAAAELGVWKRK